MQPGVFTCRRGSDAIRIVVVADLAKVERNALLHLLSAAADQIRYGREHYRFQSPDTSTIINQLFEEYRAEGLTMPYTMADFRRDVARKYLNELTAEERLAGLPAEEVLERLSPEQRLAGLPAEELLDRLSPEQRLAGLPADQIEAYLERLRRKPAASRKKKPKQGRSRAHR